MGAASSLICEKTQPFSSQWNLWRLFVFIPTIYITDLPHTWCYSQDKLQVLRKVSRLFTKLLSWDPHKTDSRLGAKVVGHDVCAFVYFHSIVFCLDFHRGEQYLRKQGRKWDENKGRGREPSVMEPAPHWSWFSVLSRGQWRHCCN